MMTLCMDLRELRRRANLTLERVAADLGRSHSTISNWESGKTLPMLNPLEFELICQLYQCTCEEFVEAVRETNGLVNDK
jgi:transcriptional regulator with XRE-family HTH domain